MAKERLAEYLESSFLGPLLKKDGVTDVCYNGENVFYQDSLRGRIKFPQRVTSEEVGCFLRQIANLSEQQFSYQSPILDVSFSKYRLNACFLNLVRVQDQKSYSFSIRLASPSSCLFSSPEFFGGKSQDILLEALKNGEPIAISGSTSSGKTELQKFLLLSLKANTRVIVIDNVEELELARGDGEIDLTSWLVDERFGASSFSNLIKNALRNNPDYLVIAESRGKEMLDVLNATMSGFPCILTLHAKDLFSMPRRMARMAMMGEQKLIYEDVISDIYHHFSLLVYLRKKDNDDGSISRYIEQIGRLNEKKGTIDILYSRSQA